MEVRNCRNCGRLFNYVGGPSICQVCREEADKKFSQVKEYIRENPRATIQMISEENEVSVQQLRQWIRQERLQFSEDSPIGIDCEICGATIRSGRYCEACKEKMKKEFGGAIHKQDYEEDPFAKKDRENRMRFLK